MKAPGKNQVFPYPNLDTQPQWTLNESNNELEAEGLCDNNSETPAEILAKCCEVDVFLWRAPPLEKKRF